MSPTPDETDRLVEALVRARLEQLADATDAEPAVARLLNTLKAPSKVETPRPRRFPRWGAVAAVAAAAVLLILGVAYSPPARADAAALVREARQVHNQPVDRCYLVEVRKGQAPLEESYPLYARARTTRLWTRGDRFWIESTNARRQWAWGRDEQGAIWIALNPRRGIRFEDGEVPEPIALTCDVCGLRLDTMLGDVLADFDLRREQAEGGSSTDVVRAELKSDRSHPYLRGATLEIDRETRVIRRATLTRIARGGRMATVTFTLLDTRPRDESRYRLEGHLREPYQVYSKEFEPKTRRKLIVREFGARAADGMKEPKD